MLLLRIFIVGLCINYSLYAQGLAPGDSVYIYSDGHFDGAFKALQKGAKEALKDKKIKWKLKGNAKASWLSLKDTVEKDLLKHKADVYVLALGLADVWDKKKKAAADYDDAELRSAIQSVVESLSSAGKLVIMCTPHVLMEGTNEVMNTHVATLKNIVVEVATSGEYGLCDIHSAFQTRVSMEEKSQRGKGITTKDGFKLNDGGEAIVMGVFGSTVGVSARSKNALKPIKLKKSDYVLIVGPWASRFPKQEFNDASKEKYKKGLSSPRFASIGMGWEFFEGDMTIVSEKLLKQKATHYFILPNAVIHDSHWSKHIIDQDIYKTKCLQLIKLMKNGTKAPIYLHTPPIWNENTEENNIDTDGPLYKITQDWADNIRAIGKESGCKVLDIHQACLDTIKEKGSAGLTFAGQRYVNPTRIHMEQLSTHGVKVVRKEMEQLFLLEVK